MSEIKIRMAVPEDASELLEIYRPYVEDTAVSFEYVVPSVEQFEGRIRKVLTKFHIWWRNLMVSLLVMRMLLRFMFVKRMSGVWRLLSMCEKVGLERVVVRRCIKNWSVC